MGKISPERVQSNTILRQWCAGVTGHVLSVGSGGDIDKQGATYRSYFANATTYTTSDVVPGCDLLLDARKMDGIADAAFDGVFLSGVLEHVDDCHSVISECRRVLKDGGVFIVGVPFKQPVHRAPGDYWRFTEYGLRWLLRSFHVEQLKAIGDVAFPFGYWAQAVKRG
jgi:SAM-dependent methyltransferase